MGQERVNGVTIYRNVICFRPDVVSLAQPAIETNAKPSLRVGGFSRWPAFAAGVAVLLLALPSLARAQAQSPAPTPEVRPQGQMQETVLAGSAVRGKELFSGQVHFENGGPPCSACHSIAGLSFPNGGTLGPNLTHEYSKLGPQGTVIVLKTLYFPAMSPIYDSRPLSPEEQADLQAFLKETSAAQPTRSDTLAIAVAGLLGFFVLLIVTCAVWRDRLRSVRRSLLEKARTQGRLQS